LASVGEKHTDQTLIMTPARNARPICAGMCKKKRRNAKQRGAATVYVSIIVRRPKCLDNRLTTTVPAMVPMVWAAVMKPMLWTAKLCSTMKRVNRKKYRHRPRSIRQEDA
jgi:hypothetical protein